MQCPKCNSDNTQRLSVIYQSGTQHISTTSRTYGGGVGSGFGGGVANTTTTGTAQSYLAGKAAPPNKKSFKWAVSIIGMGILIGALSGNFVLLLIPSAAIAGYLGYKAFRYNKDIYPGLRQAWLKSWHCNKCGDIYAEEQLLFSTKQS